MCLWLFGYRWESLDETHDGIWKCQISTEGSCENTVTGNVSVMDMWKLPWFLICDQNTLIVKLCEFLIETQVLSLHSLHQSVLEKTQSGRALAPAGGKLGGTQQGLVLHQGLLCSVRFKHGNSSNRQQLCNLEKTSKLQKSGKQYNKLSSTHHLHSAIFIILR